MTTGDGPLMPNFPASALVSGQPVWVDSVSVDTRHAGAGELAYIEKRLDGAVWPCPVCNAQQVTLYTRDYEQYWLECAACHTAWWYPNINSIQGFLAHYGLKYKSVVPGVDALNRKESKLFGSLLDRRLTRRQDATGVSNALSLGAALTALKAQRDSGEITPEEYQLRAQEAVTQHRPR